MNILSNIRYVDMLDKWRVLASVMKEKGWRRQLQYDFKHEEGFHAWFKKEGKEDVEVITRNERVEKAIVEYNLP